MKKRILSLLTTLCLLLSVVSGMVLPAAAEEIPYARELDQYPDATVFQVAEQSDLEALAAAVNGGNTMEGITFLQTADITMTGEFTPIGQNPSNKNATGNWGNPFMGTYDGQRHTISNLIVNLPSRNGVGGLFGACTGATLKNIGIESGTVTGGDRTGGIAGYADECLVLNCYNKATVIKSGGNNNGTGGIAGVSRRGTVISGCFNLGEVRGSRAVGGFSGWGDSTLVVRNSYSGGTLSGSTSSSGYMNVIARLSVTADYSSNYYLASLTGSNSHGAKALTEPDYAWLAYVMNRSEGEDSGAFTVDSEGDIVFASEDNGPAYAVTVAVYSDGAELFEDVFYLPGYQGYSVPAVYSGYDVVRAEANGAEYAPGDTVTFPAGDGRVELHVQGSFPSVDEIELYPDARVFSIATAEEFAAMAQNVNNGYTYEGKTILVTADLDFSAYETWTPVGVIGTVTSGNASDDSIGFMGHLNGQFHHFKNINMTFDGTWKGLFAYLEGAIVENIILDEGTMTSNGTKLAVIGSLVRNSTIRNIESHISLYSTSTSASINQAIASLSRSSTYEAVVNYGEMGYAESESAQENGGIVGYGYSSCVITDCYVAGVVNGTTHGKIARSGGTVTNCYYLTPSDTGTISRADFSSGLAAWNMNTLSGTRENLGLWSNSADGPVLDPQNAAYALDGVMLDKDGTQIGSLSCFYNQGTAVEFADVPGYTFKQAVFNDAVLEEGWTMPAQDCGNVTFHYENNVYNVSYVLNGGSFREEPAVSHTSGHAMTLPAAGMIQRKGYGFTGWYDNAELEGEVIRVVPGDLYSDVTYYASWGEQIPIATAQQLASITDLSGSYILVADIDLSGVDFAPIGSRLEPFTGSFDGNGYVISNLTIESGESYQGLFGYNAGMISNVTLDETCSVSGGAYTGSIAGYNEGTIVNCITDATVQCVEPEVSTYKVMSQNLCIWGSDDFSVANRQPRMLERIYNNDPDVIAFQEGSQSWVNYLEANLEGYSLIYKNRGTSSFEAVPVAYKTAKFDLVESGHFWLSETPEVKSVGWDASMYRICTYVVLRDRTNGEMISMFNVHLDHVGPESRIQSGALIRSRINALMERYEGIMLFAAGDFNCDESSDGYKSLTSAPMADVRYIAEETSELNTHSSTLTEDWVNATSTRIDFISTYEPAVEVDKFEVLAECVNGTRLSDHNGLLATFNSKTGIAFGGAVGGNAGTVQRIVSGATVIDAKESGALIGRNYDVTEDLYYGQTGLPPVGSGDASGCAECNAFTIQQVWEINRRAGSNAFTVNGDDPLVVGSRDLAVPVRVLVNEEPIFALSGDTLELNLTDYAEPVCLVNGEYFEGTVLTVPDTDTVVRIVEGLGALKEEAKAELQAYRDTFDDEEYYDEQAAQLDEAVEAGGEAIDAAENYNDLQNALTEAKAALDAVLTRYETDLSEYLAAARRAQAAAEAAEAAADAAQAAAEKAAASAAEDMSAAEAANAAAAAAQEQAEAARAAAESAQAAAEKADLEAAEEAANAAESAAAAANAAASAAQAAADAQTAQSAAEAARKAAEEAAASAAEDMTGAEAAANAADLAKDQAEAAMDAALEAQQAAEEAAQAAENADAEAAGKAADAAASAKESAASAAAAADSARKAADSAKAAQAALKAAEEAQKKAEDAAQKAREEAERIAREAALNLAKSEAVVELNGYKQKLMDGTAEENTDELTEAAKAARTLILAAETQEQVVEALAEAKAELDAIAATLCAADEFTDVEADAWYHQAIDFVLNEGIMSGNGDGTFTPDQELSRAMLVQILYNIEGKPEVQTTKSFTDVEADDWYYNAVMWAAENGIVLGNDDGTYAPNDSVTREQMVTILYRYAGSPEVADSEITFADAADIDEWAELAVAWAVENEVVKGKGDNRFDPNGSSTRAETAQVMMNYFK